MANEEHVRMLLEDGVKAWNRWREDYQNTIPGLFRADLAYANLEGANLKGVNLRGANLREADLSNADLREAELSGAKLSRANLSDANLSWADLNNANLEDANLDCANLIDAHFHEADLSNANLRGADLSGTNLIGANLTDCDLSYSKISITNLTETTIENAKVTEVAIASTRGLPKPPKVLRISIDGGKFRKLTGKEAENFFLRPEEVKIVFDRTLSGEILAGYHMFITECKHVSNWPQDIAYIGSHIEDDRTILTFQAPKAIDIESNISLLLKPFRMSAAIDLQKTFEVADESDRKELIETALARPEYKSLIAEQLHMYEGFCDATPMEIRTPEKAINIKMDPETVRALGPGSNLIINLNLSEGDQQVGDKVETTVNGGNYGIIGKQKIATVTNNIDNSQKLDTEIRTALLETLTTIKTEQISDEDKVTATEDVDAIRKEMEKETPRPGRIKRLWENIKEIAPTAASILSATNSIAEILSQFG